jgi:hypothetical protein
MLKHNGDMVSNALSKAWPYYSLSRRGHCLPHLLARRSFGSKWRYAAAVIASEALPAKPETQITKNLRSHRCNRRFRAVGTCDV